MDALKAGAVKLGFDLDEATLDRFDIYYRELIGWNGRTNLTGITEYEEVQTKHFLDSLTPGLVIASKGRDPVPSVIDIGSGGGFPGIPLKLLFPEAHVTLLDATEKKTEFLRYIVSTLELKGIDIVTGRAEDLARKDDYRDSFDFAVSRAVAPLPVLVELVLPFCRIGGYSVLLKKGDIREELQQGMQSIEKLGGLLKEVTNVNPDILPDERCLVIIEKIEGTPDRYPRRPGIPSKRPLK